MILIFQMAFMKDTLISLFALKMKKKLEKKVKEKEEYKKFKMHIDGIQEITIVDNYKVELNKI